MKKFSFNNMSVKTKITTMSAVMLIFMVIIAGVGLFASTSISNARKARYNNYAMSEYYLSEAFSNFCNIKVRVRNMPIMYFAPGVDIDFADQVNKINNYETAMYDYFAKFEANMNNLDDPAIATKYQETVKYVKSWMENTREDIELFQQGKSSSDPNDYEAAKIQAGCDDLMLEGRALADQAEASLAELTSLLETDSASNNEIVEGELTMLTVITIVVSVVGVLVAFALSRLVIGAITKPVQSLVTAANKLAVGDVDVECVKLHNDDLGNLVDEFATMASNIKEQAVIADTVSRGDLTVRVSPRGEKDLLGNALHKLVSENNETLGNVKESTEQVTIGAEQVATASQALAQGATEQASALQQVTASMNEIAVRTKQNASEANQADTLVHDVKGKAAEGDGHMKAMINAMSEINEASEMIGKIIKTIDDIAFQTNILALNAAVEAARAGVHGKGFAVVAEEVRNLAGKSASAAGETAEMIEDAIRKIGNGTKLAEETAKSLDEIVIAIDQIVELITTIATSSNDQATAISQVDQAIEQVSQVVQTNSATSQECAAASEELSNQAANLRSLMARYKLLTKGNSSFSASSRSDSDSFGPTNYNESMISLDGEFGKY